MSAFGAYDLLSVYASSIPTIWIVKCPAKVSSVKLSRQQPTGRVLARLSFLLAHFLILPSYSCEDSVSWPAPVSAKLMCPNPLSSLLESDARSKKARLRTPFVTKVFAYLWESVSRNEPRQDEKTDSFDKLYMLPAD